MEARVPFTAAEEVVDFDAHQEHIVDRRQRVESACWPDARRYAHSVHLHDGIPSLRAQNDLEARLYAALAGTYLFGYRSAVQEIRKLRALKAGRPGLAPQPSGNPPRHHLREVVAVARGGTGAFGTYVVRAWENYPDDWDRLERRSRQLLHNVVLEMIGRVLNLGRTHAALGGEAARTLTASVAPALWAMRSEQLDTNTCDPCDTLHGRIVELLSPEYLEILPPAGCLGRGRCRGIMVFADDPGDLR